MTKRKSHCPKLNFRSSMLAAELHHRAGGDINKILPALDDILKEREEEQRINQQKEKEKCEQDT